MRLYTCVAFTAWLLLALPCHTTPAGAAAARERLPQQSLTAEQAFALMAGQAEKGDLAAMLALGGLYEQGIGTPRNFIKAREWYQKAADRNSPAGLYNLGMCYEIGMGTAGDMGAAVALFQRAAALGLPEALFKLATLHAQGQGLPKDERKALDYLARASEVGHAEAANLLGLVYLRGRMGKRKDGTKAVEYFTLAARQGSVEAMKNLGVIFKDGVENKASPEKALMWYLLAWKSGFTPPELANVLTELRAAVGPIKAREAEKNADAWLSAVTGNTAPR